jgi:phosphate uptake regulator
MKVFRSILEIFRDDDWSGELVARIGEMLETAAGMFDYAVAVVVYGEKDEDPQGALYSPDRRINMLEREIRRRVVARLSAGAPGSDVPTALIFMNAVKDVERIGDYVKNLYDISRLLPADADRRLYQEHLVGRSRTLEDLFARTLRAFSESDQDEARGVIARTRVLEVQAEQAIADLARSNLRTADAVCLALGLRFYKRIAAHLSNVATTVVMPVDLLDFYDEPRP